MIVKTRAVILRETKYREQSRICLLYTRDFGKMSVIVKGARNPKNRLCGLFSPGNVVDLVLYKKSGRDIQLASSANLVLSPMVPASDMERFATLYRIIDLVRQTTDGHEKNQPLFNLLAVTLEQLYHTTTNFRQLYAWFLLQFISILGFKPSLSTCVFSDKAIIPAITEMKLSELSFVMNPGGLALPAAAGSGSEKKRSVSVTVALLLNTMATCRFPPSEPLHAAEAADMELLCELLQEYCALHLEHVRSRKNLAIVSQILQK